MNGGPALVTALVFVTPAVPGQAQWIQAKLFDSCLYASAYDEARGRLVLFGGDGTSQVATREWDGTAWYTRLPATSPTPRRGHSMCYDSARRRVVLFGGYGGALLSDLWEWDGNDWLRVTPGGPPGRTGASLACDAARARLVVFGGLGQQGMFQINLADTWEWDGASWFQRNPAVAPAAREDAGMVYDATRRRTVLFGGAIGTAAGYFPKFGDFWAWDGNTWTQPSPPLLPPGRSRQGMAFDSARGRVVMFGGYLATTTYPPPAIADTWEWDGASWVQRSPPASPGPREGQTMAYDSVRARVVLFGGIDTTASYPTVSFDTWEYDGNTWVLHGMASGSPSRVSHALAYDPVRQRTVTFGGKTQSGNESNETWEWDGLAWLRRPSAVMPPPRSRSALAFDPVRKQMLLFGGTVTTPLGDTWTWDGSTWAQLAPATAPAPREGHTMVTDLGRGSIVLFGGRTSAPNDETWEWDGSRWIQRLAAVRPPARFLHAMAYDVLRAKVVLFGGSTGGGSSLSDTWEWDGNTWTQKTPPTGPSARYWTAMAYDLIRGRTVLFGGNASTVTVGETWEWDGAAWTQQFPSPPATPRYGHAMAYDHARTQVVMLGGEPIYTLFTGTWLYGDAARVPVATTSPLGLGCAGSNGPPRFCTSLPLLAGAPCAFDVLDGLSRSPVAIGVAPATQSLALGGGCSLYLAGAPVFFATTSNASGFASVSLLVPADPALRGAPAFGQGFVLDPLGAWGGIAVTAAAGLTLGY